MTRLPYRHLRRIRLLLPLLCMGLLATSGAARAQNQAPPLDEAWQLTDSWSSLDDVVVPGAFRGPNGVDVGPNGRIYVTDGRAGAVHVLSGLGQAEGLWDGGGALSEPRDVAAADDRIYVTEPAAGRVEMLDLSGAHLGGFEVAGRPSGIAWRDGKLYVTTSGSAEIVALSPDGAELRRWGGDTIEQPGGIDVGGDGLIYVTDLVVGNGGGFVHVYDDEGLLLGMLPTMIDGSPQPAIDVAVEDRAQQPEIFIVTELYMARISSVDGLRSATRSPGGRGIAMGPGQGLVFSAQDFRQGFTGIRRIGDRRARIPEIEGWGGPFAPLGVLDAPRRVSLAADGQAFVLDQWPRVQVWDDDGNPRGQFGSGGIQDLAAGLPGSLYGIEGHTLSFWADDGQRLWTWQPPSTRPDTGVAWGWMTHADSDGSNVLVLDTGDQRVFIRDFSGNPLGEWPVSPPDGFTSIGDISLTQDTVWLLDRGALAMRRHDRVTGEELGRFPISRGARRIDARDDGRSFVLLDEGWVFVHELDGRISAAWQVDEPRGATDLAIHDDQLLVAHADDRLTRWAPDPTGTPGNVPTLELRCNLLRDKTATPTELDLGDRVRIGLTIDGDCPLADAEADILLLVDTSGSMSGPKMSAARSAVLEFVGQLDYSLHQVGLISFSTDVDLVQELTSNPRELLRAIPLLGDDAGTNMTDAMMLADRELRGRRARDEARQVVVILSDGRPNGDPTILLNIASDFRAKDREIYTIGLGADVDGAFMRRMADDQAHYFEAPTEYDLSRIYETIGRRASASALLREATIVDEIPANMAFVPDTDVPRAEYDADAHTLTWRVRDVEPGGLRLRYRLRPLEAGTHPTNVRAEADYVDGVRHSGRLVFPVPEVTVRQPERYAAYLPLTYKQKCPEARIDVVVVLDTSASMRSPQPGGGTKLESARRAATVFLSLLRLGSTGTGDRVAIAAFNGQATVVQGLTDDRATLLGALSALPTGNGTRIDRGLAAGLSALEARRPDAVAAVVLLTDGNQADEGLAGLLERAEQAREAGILLYTIGLGPDADRDLLESVAGSAERTFMAPSDEELADIYRAIAAAIPCG